MRTWDRTGCEFDSWQYHIPCSYSLQLLGFPLGSLGAYGLIVLKSICKKMTWNCFVCNLNHHPLHGFLPPKLSRVYNMRAREHDYQLPEKENSIHEKSFLIRIFFNVLTDYI